MSESRFDSRPGTRSSETTFIGCSPWKICIQYLLLGLCSALLGAVFLESGEFRAQFQVDQQVAWPAALCGGAATVLFVCAAWTWITRLRWVAVSPEGIRWRRGPRAKYRGWEQYLGIERGAIEWSIWGKDERVGRYADITFRHGRPLRISTHTLDDYDDLIAEIQIASADAIRILFTADGSRFGSHYGSRCGLTDSKVEAYGPLRLDPDGLEWDGTHYRWDEIEDYEIAVGYLRIQPTEGPEFLRRLSELGDWQPAVALLDTNVGSRRSAPTKSPPSSPELATASPS